MHKVPLSLIQVRNVGVNCSLKLRKIFSHPQKYPQTRWGNPYAKYLKKLGRDRVIKMYQEYIFNKPELMKLISIELKGKSLGCWCKPLPCHGDVLGELADADN